MRGHPRNFFFFFFFVFVLSASTEDRLCTWPFSPQRRSPLVTLSSRGPVIFAFLSLDAGPTSHVSDLCPLPACFMPSFYFGAEYAFFFFHAYDSSFLGALPLRDGGLI